MTACRVWSHFATLPFKLEEAGQQKAGRDSVCVTGCKFDGDQAERMGRAPEDGDAALLAEPPRPLPRLDVCRGVPVRVIQQHPVRPRQVDSQAADPRRQQEHKDRVVAVEVVDHAGAQRHRDGAVHAVVAHRGAADVALEDVKHLLRLREEQRLVPLRSPISEHLQVGCGYWWHWGSPSAQRAHAKPPDFVAAAPSHSLHLRVRPFNTADWHRTVIVTCNFALRSSAP